MTAGNAHTLAARRDRVFGAGAPLFYREPLHIVRGEGVYLFDADGRRYLDLYNNVPSVGHGHPRVVQAMAAQQAMLNVHSRYLHEGAVAFAERLVGLNHSGVASVVFSCTGTEANEVAIRMARIATGRHGVVCSSAAYHGNSELVGALNPFERRRAPSEAVRVFPTPELYRPIAPGADQARNAEAYLERLQEAISALEGNGAGFAALIVCPIFANDGLPDIPKDFMRRACEMAHAAGGLVISDEVQAGYCRTGAWWGYQHAGFEPDITVLGKAMGAGLPLAATMAGRDVVEGFRARTHYFNTFAASPLQAAVGMAVLDVIEAEGLAENAARVGAAFKAMLRQRQPMDQRIGDVRGAGLFLGVEVVRGHGDSRPDKALAVEVVNRLKSMGFLTANAGVHGNVIKLRPPLAFSLADAEAFVEAFDQAMSQTHV
ncbi:aminotransferase class III-fold pyridoxal phosphate-dependent enzyme [Phenylobacterium sp.]|uniref:aspartate aminotransferase family protein n=1 Tax=Phenylobacterium sp. TaxID=1871053 RepID=UPI00289A940B|nr:aminotransferase class III-fold pyridoxal phosphate-dependent enzyme [Phenylobacterium sp.]